MADLVNRSFPLPRGWRRGHLQSIRSRVLPRPWRLDDVGDREDFLVDMHDGSGDRLAASLHRPVEPVAGRPLVLLVHGLGGSAESSYVLASARGFLRALYLCFTSKQQNSREKLDRLRASDWSVWYFYPRSP